MDSSVVVPTLNGRETLSACIDALSAHAPAETIVVNGPSADGTSGMVRDHDGVDVLVEIADRNVNAARNAGIEVAEGEVIAFVDERSVIDSAWFDGVAAAIADGADVVAGPVREGWLRPRRRRFGGREVTYFDGGNVALTRGTLSRLDGFDEYLPVGGSRDAAHRVARQDLRTDWIPEAAVSRSETGSGRDPDLEYRSRAYRLAKNYGVRPAVVGRTLRHAVDDGIAAFREVLSGEIPASRWLGDGRDVTRSGVRGVVDGLRARYADRRPARNPHGISSRTDRAVRVHDTR